MSRNANRPPAGARYKRAEMLWVRLGQDRQVITKECPYSRQKSKFFPLGKC